MSVEMRDDALAAFQQHMQSGLQSVMRALEKEKAEVAAERNAVAEERHMLEQEKKAMQKIAGNAVSPSGAIVVLNVGGKLFTTTRSTLCVEENSLLASMFSGRWENSLQRDENGNVFLDFNPTVFSLLLDYLRAKQLAAPDMCVPFPSPSLEHGALWGHMIDYFGIKPKFITDKFSAEVNDSSEEPNGCTLSESDAVCTHTGTPNKKAFANGRFTAQPGKLHVWKIQVLGCVPAWQREDSGARWVGCMFQGKGRDFIGVFDTGTTFNSRNETAEDSTHRGKKGEVKYTQDDVLVITLDTRSAAGGTLHMRVVRTGWEVVVGNVKPTHEYCLCVQTKYKGQGWKILHQ
eukprot:GDKI01005534.1.p1 GENE.GDKI01005534.1~~GDKI01005534.1.p1  ORF type:complete len:347 (+),score=66.89 GDKI01005534.1:33-1073(+)